MSARSHTRQCLRPGCENGQEQRGADAEPQKLHSQFSNREMASTNKHAYMNKQPNQVHIIEVSDCVYDKPLYTTKSSYTPNVLWKKATTMIESILSNYEDAMTKAYQKRSSRSNPRPSHSHTGAENEKWSNLHPGESDQWCEVEEWRAYQVHEMSGGRSSGSSPRGSLEHIRREGTNDRPTRNRNGSKVVMLGTLRGRSGGWEPNPSKSSLLASRLSIINVGNLLQLRGLRKDDSRDVSNNATSTSPCASSIPSPPVPIGRSLSSDVTQTESKAKTRRISTSSTTARTVSASSGPSSGSSTLVRIGQKGSPKATHVKSTSMTEHSTKPKPRRVSAPPDAESLKHCAEEIARKRNIQVAKCPSEPSQPRTMPQEMAERGADRLQEARASNSRGRAPVSAGGVSKVIRERRKSTRRQDYHAKQVDTYRSEERRRYWAPKE